MSKNINLVLKEEAEEIKQKKKVQEFRLIAMGLLLVVLLISLSVYLLKLRVGTSFIEKDKGVLFSQLIPLRDKEAKIRLINDRSNNISQVQGKINDVYKIVNTILEEVPIGMSVDYLEFSKKSVAIKVSSNTLLLVDEFFNNLTKKAQKKEIISVLELNSLDLAEIGKYTVSIGITLL